MNIKSIYLLTPVVALISMGNKGCEQPQQDTRILKMDVDIGHIKTLSLKINNQDDILIDTLSKELFSRSIFSHNRFTVLNQPESTQSQKISSKSAQSQLNSRFSNKDLSILSKYGFLNSEVQSQKINGIQSEIPNCQWEKPQLTLNSDVLGFELSDRTGLELGYSPSGTHLDEIRGKIKFINFRLDYGITAIHPLLNRVVGSTNTVEYKSSIDLAFDFGKNAPLTIDFFYQEGMVKVIKDGMRKSLDELVTQLQKQTTGAGKDWNKDIWESRVLFDPAICDTNDCIAVRGGTMNGIKIGDHFNVTNMIHTWDGEPCQSKLLRSIPDVSTTKELIIESVGDAVSVGRFQTNQASEIQPGAMVRLKEFLATTQQK